MAYNYETEIMRLKEENSLLRHAIRGQPKVCPACGELAAMHDERKYVGQTSFDDTSTKSDTVVSLLLSLTHQEQEKAKEFEEWVIDNPFDAACFIVYYSHLCEDTDYLLHRLERTLDLLESGEVNMAITKIHADISALR